MVEIKDKVVLKEKGEVANLPTVKQLAVTLGWSSAADLDLMAFFKRKNGEVGGVFSNLLGGSLGDLNAFPFIKLSGDEGVGGTGGEKTEELKIVKLDDIAELHLVAYNYEDRKKADVNFANYDGHIQIINETGEAFDVPLKSTEVGAFAHIATIDNTSPVGATLKMVDQVMNGGQLVETIPGASALSK